ncbi:hypothetical protein ACJX0J_037629, partial [Zea mays]
TYISLKFSLSPQIKRSWVKLELLLITHFYLKNIWLYATRARQIECYKFDEIHQITGT